jgi:hypothetical protein
VEVVSNFIGIFTDNTTDFFSTNIDIPSKETTIFPDLESELNWELGERSEGR